MTNEDTANIDTAKISEEVSGLKAELSKFIDTVTEYIHSHGGDAAHRIQGSAEETWNEAKTKLCGVKHQIEEEPVTSAAIAFGAGLLVGLILSARRK